MTFHKVTEDLFTCSTIESPEIWTNINWTNKFLQNITKHNLWLCPQALIPLALEGTDAGKTRASHALAKIAAISNPEIAFPGERVRHTTVVVLFISMEVPFDMTVGGRRMGNHIAITR